MADLFNQKQKEEEARDNIPLSVRMRPSTLEEFVGQKHILEKDSLLRRAIQADRLSSLILYGPPGSGKTSLGKVIAVRTRAQFRRLNAVTSSVNELRSIIEEARKHKKYYQERTILFVDEINRFNKLQQDALITDVEEGNVVLIGATTHNPYFSINPALLSRSQIFQLELLEDTDLELIVKRALKNKEKGLGKLRVEISNEALKHLIAQANGDARRALNTLEIAVLTTQADKDKRICLNLKIIEDSCQKKVLLYDRDEDEHYDTISAFIKSMRGSDPDAALYWLAKMICAGEDPRFIARRIVICAAEDVGNADPQALVVANAAFQVSEFIGMPEAKIPLAQAVVYVATAPKSNAVYMGIEKALKDIESERTQAVPKSLKDSHYRGAEKLEHGKNYKYAHNFSRHYVKQAYMPEKKSYYLPTVQGYERKIKTWLEELRKNGKKTK